ncbi:Vegetative incompatibility protein HET-E-1-like protein 20 [Fusarium austroafricanum]|uniref:Vegetative incompatibility protein HET-E-1-like protein 20 n=1 Tax=Fusarium austroafricanum TaxID=2364996 RepID=A0A8H4KW16_9HYPO|nr:Vegetative incompatibility protein HET-E-1-like protein 20 [Fusarium austroafricanum]
MANITASCELMDNAFPAGPLMLRGKFSVVLDSNGECMIFSVDNTGSLCLILKGTDGHNELLRLGPKFGVADDQQVTAFAVSQNAKDHRVNLVFAVRQKDGSGRLLVIEPMEPKREVWSAENLQDNLYTGNPKWNINISDIMLAGSSDERGVYPQIHLVFNHLDKATEDIWAVSVKPLQRIWAHDTVFQMTVNALDILDLCPGVAGDYRGLYVLYKERSSTQLRFMAYDSTDPHPTMLPVVQTAPDNANKLTGLVGEDGTTDLLISGSKLTYCRGSDFQDGETSPFIVISDYATTTQLSQLQVVQEGDKLSSWSLTKDNSLSYQEFVFSQNKPPTAITSLIPLLDRVGSGGRFATARSATFGHKLFVANDDRTIKMLEQNNQTGIWQPPVDIMIPDSGRMITFSSYTIHASLSNKDEVPLPNIPLQLLSSSPTELIVNGKSMRGSTEGDVVHTDGEGALTIIIRSEALSAPTITLQNVPSSPNTLVAKKIIDPMSKVWTTIGEIASSDNLKNMELSNGKKFVREGVSDKEVEDATKALKELVKTKNEISEGKPSVSVSSQSISNAGDRNWGALYWLWSKVEEGWNFLIEKAEEGWNFVVKLGKKAWNFLIETVQHVAAAVQTILEAISDGWEQIKQKLSFIFNWSDIVAVKNVLVNVATRGILLAADSAQSLEEKAQAFFDDTEAKIGMMREYQDKLPREILDIPLSPNAHKQKKLKSTNSQAQKHVQSPQGQYGLYHAKHSGAVGPRKEGEPTWDRIWKRLQDVIEKIQNLVKRTGTNLFVLLGKEDATVGDLISQVGIDFAEDFVSLASSVVTGILGSLSDLFLEIADKINASIDIPVLSPLYRLLTGNDLTVLDAVCLIIAIPATLVYKTTTGSNPLDIEGIGHYTRTGDLKRELDTRMTRKKSQNTQSNQQTQQAQQFQVQRSFNISAAQAMPDMKPSERKTVTPGNSNSHSSGSGSGSDSKSDNKKDTSENSQKEFTKAHGKTGKILKTAVATGGLLWYNYVTFPSIFTPEGAVWLTLLSGAGKFAIWFAQFSQLADWDMETGDATIVKKLKNDSLFVPRFVSWAFGSIEVLGRVWSKYAGNIGGVITASGQVACLVWVIVESIDVKGSYAPLLGIEEWLKVIGKFGTHVSGIEGGADPYNAGLSYGLSSIGNAMFMARSLSELSGAAPQFSGVDSD